MRSSRRVRRFLLLLLGAFLTTSVVPGPAEAQVPAGVAPSDTVWEIRLGDGTTILGQVIATTPEQITVRTAAGVTIEIQRPLVQRMSRVQATIRDGRVWPSDPNRTRLFFGPSGRMLEAGDGYVGVFELFLPFASYAVTDYLTIAGGTPIIPEVIGRVWYFAPKLGGMVSERTALSAGILAFRDFESALDSDVSTVGIGYVVGTRGDDDRALTAGVGWGFVGDEVENRPVFLIGGEMRTSPRLKLLSENYLITHVETDVVQGVPRQRTRATGIMTGGVRFMGDRLSADAGLATLIDDRVYCCLPLVNFVYNFGGR